MLQTAIQHPDIQNQLKKLIYEILQDEGVQKYTENISEQVVHKLLSNEEVKKHSEEFLSETFSSNAVRESCGDGLNAAAWHAFTPKFWGKDQQSTKNLNE